MRPSRSAFRPVERANDAPFPASRNNFGLFGLSGEWNDDDYDVLADGFVVGRIMKAAAVPVGMSWMWTLVFGHQEDRTPMHG